MLTLPAMRCSNGDFEGNILLYGILLKALTFVLNEPDQQV